MGMQIIIIRQNYATLQSIPGRTRYPRPNPTTQPGQVRAAVGHQGAPPGVLLPLPTKPSQLARAESWDHWQIERPGSPGTTEIPLHASLPVLPRPPYRRSGRRERGIYLVKKYVGEGGRKVAQ